MRVRQLSEPILGTKSIKARLTVHLFFFLKSRSNPLGQRLSHSHERFDLYYFDDQIFGGANKFVYLSNSHYQVEPKVLNEIHTKIRVLRMVAITKQKKELFYWESEAIFRKYNYQIISVRRSGLRKSGYSKTEIPGTYNETCSN